MILGTHIVLAVLVAGEYTPIAYGRQCEIEAEREFLEVSGQEQNGKEYKPDRKEFTLKCTSLMSDDISQLESVFRNKQSVIFRMYNLNKDYGRQFNGTAYIDSIKCTGNVNNMGTMDVGLRGTEELYYSTFNIVRLCDKAGTPLNDKNDLILMSHIKS